MSYKESTTDTSTNAAFLYLTLQRLGLSPPHEFDLRAALHLSLLTDLVKVLGCLAPDANIEDNDPNVMPETLTALCIAHILLDYVQSEVSVLNELNGAYT